LYFGFRDICVSYGSRPILDGVTMDFARGSITTIIGPNGCGKSTLLKTVSRTVVPASGEVVLEDRPITAYSVKAVAQRVAYLPQIRMSPRDIDIRTLVSYGRYPYRVPGRRQTKEDAEAIDRALALAGLEGMGSRLLNNLSGGEKQRAWIAMTICQSPEILLLDEPTTHLDIGYQLEVLELVRDLRQKLGITVVMVLHDMNFTARYSDCIYVLKDRAVQCRGTPAEIIEPETMRRIFSIGARILVDEKNGCPLLIPEKLPADETQ